MHARLLRLFVTQNTTQNGSTRTRPKIAGNSRKHPSHTGAVETMQHTALISRPKYNTTRSMRLHPHTREGINHGAAPTSTREGPGKSPHPKGNTATGHCQARCHTSNTIHPTPWRPCTALDQTHDEKRHAHKCTSGAGEEKPLVGLAPVFCATNIRVEACRRNQKL